MGDEMIERVKQALLDALWEHLCDADGLALQGGRLFISGADCHVDLATVARAAIEAMREPTTLMVVSGLSAHHLDTCKCGVRWAITDPDDTWPAMIDAALSQSSQEKNG